MADAFTCSEIRALFPRKLRELAREFEDVCAEWEDMVRSNTVAWPYLVLNTVQAERGVGLLGSLIGELRKKQQDAVSGVYKYRDLPRYLKARREKGLPVENYSEDSTPDT
ncbi:MAG: hypothetical protein ACYTBJ_16115 [Planctomycetota bacterium]|jgi:hypothetical protein